MSFNFVIMRVNTNIAFNRVNVKNELNAINVNGVLIFDIFRSVPKNRLWVIAAIYKT